MKTTPELIEATTEVLENAGEVAETVVETI